MRTKRMKHKIVMAVIGTITCISFLSGCGKAEQRKDKQENNEANAEETAEKNTNEKETSIIEPTEQQTTEKNGDMLPDSFPQEFVFASGAGAWGTSITLNRDGSFEGIYQDSEMGNSSEEYPHGSVYICEFSGQFHDIKQVNANTYSMALSEVNVLMDIGKEWIEDEIRYVASEPYGLEHGTEFLLYTPETPIEGLSEEFLSWWLNCYLQDEGQEELLCYGLYNTEMEYGFFTYE